MSAIKFSTWQHYVDLIELPLREEVRAVYDAATPYQAEALAAMWSHLLGGKTDVLDKANNFYGLMTEGSFYGLQPFTTCVEATQEWMRRREYLPYIPLPTTPANHVATLTTGIMQFDAQPVPVPETMTDPSLPLDSDLRTWFCSNKKQEFDQSVFDIWKGICQSENRWPELNKITDDTHGRRIYHFDNGLKIFLFEDRAGVIHTNKDRL